LLRTCVLISLLSVGSFAQRAIGTPTGGNPGIAPDPNQGNSLEFERGSVSFRTKAQIVLVPVVVKDKQNNPVKGLTKDAFTIFENGKERPIEAVDEISGSAAPAQAVRIEGGVSNRVLMPQSADSAKAPIVAVIALDMVNTPVMAQGTAKQAILDFLAKNIPDGALVQLVAFRTNGVHLIHDFTADPKILRAALAKVRGEMNKTNTADARQEVLDLDAQMDFSDPTLGPYMRETYERIVDNLITATDFQRQKDSMLYTLQSFNTIAKSLAGIRGRKSLIWMTADAPFVLSSPTTFTALDPGRYSAQQDAGRHTVGDLYVQTMQALSAANVAVYPVDVRGLQGVGLSSPNMRVTKLEAGRSTLTAVQTQMVDAQRDSLDTMQTVAEMTGGQAFYNSNDLAGSIGRAANDSDSYYMLSYRLNTDDTKAGWRKLNVKVKGEGVKVRSRQGFFVTQSLAEPAQNRKWDLYYALHSPLNETGMPLDIYLTPQPPAGGKVHYEVEMTLPPNMPDPSVTNGDIDIDFGILVRTADGKEQVNRIKTFKNKLAAAAMAQIRESGITIKEVFDLPAGAYQATFVTRDNLSGRVGSVAVPLKVEATEAKK
jgi:VWFA-related protein